MSWLEEHEPSYEEYYRVPVETARVVNETRASGKRIVAIGTTVVRALETVTDEKGVTHPGEGLTSLVITSEFGLVGALPARRVLVHLLLRVSGPAPDAFMAMLVTLS